jgi:predicted NAD/FAD-binding protein
MPPQTPKKIAIIGTGISGLGAASILHPHYDITLYEKNDYIGGHSRTVTVKTEEGIVPVDTGFIVFNKRNYPLLTRLFDFFGVPIVKSRMSFGASINGGFLEYGTEKISHMFARKKNWVRPEFWRMIFDILKFNKMARGYISYDPSFTLGDCLNEIGTGKWFRNYFLLPMGSAIWSMPFDKMLQFPASTFIRFFDNHGLLTVRDQPQWYTVQGGSCEYIRRITNPFKDRIHLRRGVQKVWRTGEGVMVEDVHGHQTLYNDVVFACHADQALGMIVNPSADETNMLSAFRYQPNRMVLHGDVKFMPRNRKIWASWVYLSNRAGGANASLSLSYWMNNLQPLQTSRPIIVTLNPGHAPDPNLVYDEYIFHHPVFDAAAIYNQTRIEKIQGIDHFWFCGAYQRYGFHEDGLASAVQMTERMGVRPPW